MANAALGHQYQKYPSANWSQRFFFNGNKNKIKQNINTHFNFVTV